jgi:hypothetical protein
VAGFSAEWLALREPADHAARSADVTQRVLDALPLDQPLRVLDLAAGTGSNLRYLVSAFAGPAQRPAPTPMGERPVPTPVGADLSVRPSWLLVDHDPALLARVPETPGVETRCLDLSTLDDRGIFEGRSLVTASALLDLVSEDWLRALAARCAESGAAALFALSYDGRISCSPEDPEDAAIVALVNEHQRTDKGFGPALGPDATDCAERVFAELGYLVTRARSDWMLTPASGELQRRLTEGWAQAATEIAPHRARVIDGWRDRRLAHVAAGWSEMIVGHEDLAGSLGAVNLGI